MINQFIFLKHPILFDGSWCHLQTASYFISQKRFQPHFHGQCFLRKRRKQFLQPFVNFDVMLNNKEMKLSKFAKLGSGYFKHKSIFLRQEMRI